MDHEQASDLLAAYLDGEMSGEERRQVEAHLAGCGVCRGELASLREAQRALKQAFGSAASATRSPPGAWSRLEPELQAPRPSLLFLFRRRKWRIVATAIVALMVIALGLLWLTGALPGLR